MGDEAQTWRELAPQRAWLANYTHDQRPGQRLTARMFSFATTDAARTAYEHVRPRAAAELRAGDAGCWTDDGVLVLWGRLVIEIFGNAPQGVARPEQAVYLLAFLEKAMPAGLEER
ncbi:MAG: hypothetical protein HRF50_15730 [Phycisphaerae bacterium]|jgi:hypothetical protein